MMAMSMTVGACPCQAELSALRLSRISAFSSGFRATSLELISKVQSFVSVREQKRRSGGQIQLRVRVDLNWEKEEARWVREEQRWMREEQRWLREESRWLQEKQELLEESSVLKKQVAVLKLQLEELRAQVRQDEVTDASLRSLVTGMKTLLQALSAPVSEYSLALGETDNREIKQISRTASSPSEAPAEVRSSIEIKPLNFVAPPELIAVVTSKDAPIKSNGASNSATPVASQLQPTASTSQTAKETGKASTSPAKIRRTLKSGMGGDDVKELQEALEKLGFYSGEEEMEFSMFSDGTESAVKTWQSTMGVPEDGLVTAQLLATLLGVKAEETEKEEPSVPAPKKREVTTPKKSPVVVKNPLPKEEPATRSSREIDRYERTNAEDTNGSQRRVYLLGENRWEEPGRLTIKTQQSQNGHGGMKLVVDKCFSCRGVGTMLCTDCEGTGDLNVEEQFLEWLDGEEPKCPYCEGVGAVPCDVCDGEGVQAVKK